MQAKGKLKGQGQMLSDRVGGVGSWFLRVYILEHNKTSTRMYEESINNSNNNNKIVIIMIIIILILMTIK